MEIRTIWRRRPRPNSSHRLALATAELPDAAVARIGRGTRLTEVETGQMREFLRAGGAVVARR
jgi:hypothetical protein